MGNKKEDMVSLKELLKETIENKEKIRVCTKCLKPLPLDTNHFYRDKKSKHGLKTQCKKCLNKPYVPKVGRRKSIKCCDVGEFKCTIPMPINGRLCDIDYCIAHIVAALNVSHITTVASCCGHDKIDGSIVLSDGRELVIRKFEAKNYVKD